MLESVIAIILSLPIYPSSILRLVILIFYELDTAINELSKLKLDVYPGLSTIKSSISPAKHVILIPVLSLLSLIVLFLKDT